MIISKSKLQEALEIVKPGLANKEIVDQFTSFAFLKERVITYNDEISISHYVKGLEIEGAIKADKIYSLLQKIKKDELDLKIVKNELVIESGNIKSGMLMQTEVTLPLSEVNQKKEWKPLPENFSKFVNLSAGSCSKDMSKQICCVHVQKKGFIEGTDNYRLTKCDLKQDMPVDTFLIPAQSALQVTRIEPTKIALTKGWVFFRNDFGTTISCRTFADDVYPDTSRADNIKGMRLNLPKTIESALERARIIAKEDHSFDEIITVMVSKNRLKMKASSETTWYEETINLKYDGEPIEFMITPIMLKGIINEAGECEYTSNRLIFRGQNWMYLAALREVRK